MEKILVTLPRQGFAETFLPPDVERRLAAFDVTYNNSPEDFSPQGLAAALAGVSGCLTGWGTPRFDAQTLAGAGDLRIVAHTGGSVAPIVSPELYDAGVRVSSGNALYAESVAEGCVGYFLCALRRIPYYNRELRAGRWWAEGAWTEGLLGQTVGLVSLGAIAKNLIRMLQPFRCKILVYSRSRDTQENGFTYASLEQIFETCKVISIHTALNEQTAGMINRSLLQSMQDGAVLVNTARGAILDEAALAAELETGRVSAVLDVFQQEPLPPGHIFTQLENVLVMPHMGGPTVDRRALVTHSMVDELERCFAGQPLRYEIPRALGLNMSKV
jgi:phosphoglycerate dehydrogenase-like enzyme